MSIIETQGAFENKLATLTAKLGNNFPVASEVTMPNPDMDQVESVAKVIHDLVGVATQLSRLEKTIAQVSDGAPDADEAKQWHLISLQALQCSRNMLAEKQVGYLNKLKAFVPEVESTSHEAVAGPGLGAPPGLSAPQQQPSATTTPTWMGWSEEAVNACPEFVPQDANKNEGAVGGGSLRQDLEMLRNCDPDSVMIVRKIKKLGFESPTTLKQHFQQYGEVNNVHVAHSHVKPTAKRPNGRVRPAALGFVVMSDANEVENVLAAGTAPTVSGVTIEVSRFTAFSEVEEEEQ